MINAMKKTNGAGSAKAVCDDCNRSEIVAARYHPAKRPRPRLIADESLIIKKLINSLGWSCIKGKLRCPECDAKRKQASPPKPPSNVTQLRSPTRAQRRAIHDLLGEVYDTTAERYLAGDTDDAVAEVLEVMPGWVAEIRAESFGPDGGNEDIEALRADIATQTADLKRMAKSIDQAVEVVKLRAAQALAMEKTNEDLAARLEKITVAVGRRIRLAAGV